MIENKIMIISNCILFIGLSIWSGRETGYVIDKQNRDIGGKPCFVKMPQRWRWLFRFQKNMYTDRYMILRASVILHLLGYISALIELVLFVIALGNNNLKIISVVSQVYVICMLLGAFAVFLPNSIRYSHYMKRAYEYDWITEYQEQLTQRSKRRCKVVSKVDDNTYEITLGRLGKKRYRAKTEVPIEIGDDKYAIHIYHPIDDDTPYWIIKNH